MTDFDPAAGPYCPRCGTPVAATDHRRCSQALALEPPRYCTVCRRRLKVQVMPTGWLARCSAHGPVTAATGQRDANDA